MKNAKAPRTRTEKPRCSCSPDCPIPPTTEARAEYHNATCAGCECLDKENPKRPSHCGSWRDPVNGDPICKHQHLRRLQQKAFEQLELVQRLRPIILVPIPGRDAIEVDFEATLHARAAIARRSA